MNPSTRSKLIRLAYEKPELREKILPLIKQADEGGEEAKAGPSKRPGGKFIQFMKEMGDEKVRNPDTGNDVKIKSLKGERGQKIQQDEFKNWLKSQEKAEGKSEDKGSDKPSGSGGKSNPLKPIDVDFPALHKIVGKENTNYVVRWFSDGETADTSSADAFRNVIKDKVIKGFGDELERSSRGQKVLKKLDSLSDDELAQVEHAIFGKKASLRSQLIRLAHEKPELRKHLLPLIKKEGGSVNMKVSEGYPYIRYRIENEGLPTARCMVVFTYRVGKKSTVAQSLISDLNEFKKRCFSMTKSLESLFRSRNLGSLDFKEDFVRIELATQYPLLGKYTAYFNIDSDAFNDSVEQMRAILENGFGATDIRS